MAAFVAVGAIALIFFAGVCAHIAAEDDLRPFWLISLVFLAAGLFGIYALIVGK